MHILIVFLGLFMEEFLQFYHMLQEGTLPNFSTLKKDKIFNVRKLPYKQFDNQKYLKYNLSPLLKKQPFAESTANLNKIKNLQYQFQLAIMATPEYKEMHARLLEIKRQQRVQKQAKIKFLKEKQSQLLKLQAQRRRIVLERKALVHKRNQLRRYFQQLGQGQQENYEEEQESQVNVQSLRNMLMNMHYQGGWDIDIDNMTYQQLLQLQEKMGKVSKGLTQEQYSQLTVTQTSKDQQAQLCSICYCGLKQGQQIFKLPCGHVFHCQCIKQWFKNEKVCPMCKQQITIQQKKQA